MARKRDAREGCPDTDGADGLGGEGLLKLGGCQDRKVTLLYQRQEVLISGDQRIGLSGHSQLEKGNIRKISTCLLYTSPSPRDVEESRMPSSA